MAFIAPRFRQDSWYGRLYVRAYGEDRGWIVFLRRLFGRTGFEPPTRDVVPEDATENQRAFAETRYEDRYADAYARCVVFLRLPPNQEPFFADGRRVSICPTFWKIVFALVVYVPFVVVVGAIAAAFAHVLAELAHMIAVAVLRPIAAVFAFAARRFGPAFVGAGILTALWVLAFIVGTAIVGAPSRKERTVPFPVSVAQLAADDAATRARLPEVRRQLTDLCSHALHVKLAYHRQEGIHHMVPVHSSIDWIAVGGFGECRVFSRYREPTYGRRGEFTGDTYEYHYAKGWDVSLLTAAVSAVTGNDRYVGWLGRAVAADLRRHFAAILTQEAPLVEAIAAADREDRDRRERKAAIEDGKVWEEFGRLAAILWPLRSDPFAIYRKLEEHCEVLRSEWENRPFMCSGRESEGSSGAACAIACTYVEPDLTAAIAMMDARRAAERDAEVRRYAAKTRAMEIARVVTAVKKGAVFGGLVVLGAFAFIAFLIGLGVMAPAIGRVLTAIGNAAWVTVKWATVPVWGLPYLAVLGWRSAAAVAWRRRFRQEIRDTWALVRAYARAVKERACPFIEWVGASERTPTPQR